jgi:hypothetical protein
MGELIFRPNEDGVMLGEPVTTPSGDIICLWKVVDGVLIDKSVAIGGYTDDEIGILGDGDWRHGLVRVAQAAYQGNWAHLDPRPLNVELPPRK